MKQAEHILLDQKESKINHLSFGLFAISSSDFISGINRLSLFTVFFWFGMLKVLGQSPAETLITHLHTVTISSYISFENFMILFGTLECLIGLMWLIPKLTVLVFTLFIFQMFTTFLPFYFLTEEILPSGFALSLTGQYIVKNVVLVSCAFTIFFNHKFKI